MPPLTPNVSKNFPKSCVSDGDFILFTPGNPGYVVLEAGGGSGTLPTSDAADATIGSPIPTTVIVVGAEDPSGHAQPLKVDVSGNLLTTSSGGGSGNPAAGPTGSPVPGDADYIGINVGGNLVGVSATNPLPVSGSFSNPSVSTTGTAVPASATFIGGTDGTNLRALSVDGTGKLNVNVSAIVADTVNQGSPAVIANSWPVEVTDGTNVLGVTAHPLRIDPTGTTTQPVSGTVAVSNFPATQPVSGTVTVVQPTGTNLHVDVDQPLPAGTNVIGHVIADTGSTTTVTGNVTVVQPTGTNLHAVLDATSTTTVTQATGTNLHTVLDSGTLTSITNALPAGANVIGHVIADTGSTTAVTGNVTVVQATGTNLHAVIDSGTVTAASTDSSPATQNITARDTASTSTVFGSQTFITGTPTAGSSASFSLSSGFDTVRVQVTGTWTGILSAETSTDSGTTWLNQEITLPASGSSFVSSSFNFIGYGNIGATTNFRIRSSGGAWTGTATVKVVFSINTSSVSINNDNSITITALPPVEITGATGGVLDAFGSGTNLAQGWELIVGGVNDPLGANLAWPMTMDASGRLITTGAGGTFPATQSGTWTTRVVGNAGAIVDSANVATAPANVIQVGGRFTTSPSTLTTGQAASLNLDSSQNLLTKVNVALPTGANTIGAVTQASGPWTTNMTQWGSTTLGTPTNFGTTPTAVIAGSVNASMFSGTTALGTPNTFGTTAPTGAALGTNSSLFVGTTLVRTNQTTTATGTLDTNLAGIVGTTAVTAAAGVLKVGISGATAATMDSTVGAATAPTNALATSVRYTSSAPALTANQAVMVQSDSAGTVFVRPYRRSQYKATPVTITASTTPVTAVAAQGAAVFADVTGFFVTVTTAATTATAFTITLSDGTANYVFDLDTGALATASADPTILSLAFPSPLPATTANTAWTATSSSATPTMHIVTTFIINIAN